MFIINSQGTLIYNGAIDDRPTADLADVNGAKNYVRFAAGGHVRPACEQPDDAPIRLLRQVSKITGLSNALWP
jgi:hypothetical protein